MSVVPAPAREGRVPRYVWALVIVAVLVLGFALGGTLRTAVAAGFFAPDPTGGAAPGGDLLGAPAGSGALMPRAELARAAPTAVTHAAATGVVRSAVRAGVPLPAHSG